MLVFELYVISVTSLFKHDVVSPAVAKSRPNINIGKKLNFHLQMILYVIGCKSRSFFSNQNFCL